MKRLKEQYRRDCDLSMQCCKRANFGTGDGTALEETEGVYAE